MANETSLLDQAWAARAAGRSEDAIRASMALVAADEGQLHAAALLLELLADAGRTDGLDAAGIRLVDAFVRRGNLPRALAVRACLAEAGVNEGGLTKTIASAFSRSSERLGDVAPAPPPLPVDADAVEAKGAALLDAAETVLRMFVSSDDAFPEDRAVPTLPLFGALPTKRLRALLGVFEILEVEPGDVVIEEGTEGKDAFVIVRGRLEARRHAGEEEQSLAQLGPGAIFGEMALVSEAPRAASVVALEPTQLLVAHRDDLEKLAKKTPEIGTELSDFCRARMVANLVRHSAVLQPLDPAERAALIERFEARRFKAGEALVTRGEEIEGLFLIASGSVRVMGEDSDGDALQVAELGPGDIVGEISIVLRRPATADVVATHPTVALELRREAFQAAIKEHPGLLGELYELATKRDEELRTVVAQEALDIEEPVLL
ncbi:MAG: cyclic nucleotide-binding domain-containing protein [Sandaracinaceae bacterium]